jgi:hypothetical protein
MTDNGNREVGANVTEDEYNVYLKRIQVFQSWFSDNIVPSDSSVVAVFPYGATGPAYRQNRAEYATTFLVIFGHVLT